jgi:hypothetical protein
MNTRQNTDFTVGEAKHPLPGRVTGELGIFFVGLRVVLGDWVEKCDVLLPLIFVPQFPL